MIDLEKLNPILEGYKAYFPSHWDDEKYKWEAVKHFRDHWDMDAENFGDMFKQATDKTFNLLASGYAYPRGMIINFAKADDEAARAMFRNLFDEDRDLAARVDAFRTTSEELRAKYDDGTWRNHYQNTNAVSTYLWLRYPDKYYIYKYELFRAAARELSSDYTPQRNGSVESLIGGNQMYDEICEAIKADPDIRGMIEAALVPSCYPDPEMKTATIDVVFYLARYYPEERKSEQEEEVDLSGVDLYVKGEDAAVRKYSKEDFLSKVYMTEERYDVLEALLRNKMNVILQGAPGVGKTFTAKKLAYAMMGEADDSRIEMVQFHQNYSYEDFIMGYRPDGADFKLTEGIFYRFCQTAANFPDKEYFFIIDEINRGNMSKIFGELLMLIEKDYRGTKATLAYNGMPFSVPENLYIIGMMNTADRSLAMIDYALRRRFGFFEMEPGFNSDGFTNYQNAFGNETFNALIDQIKVLNKEITEDKALGRGFQIGHSYFCGREELGCTDEWMRSVVEFDILPMLGEYWFDEPDKLSRWEKNLRGVFDD